MKLSSQELSTFGRIDYDFNPEHDCELGCLRGEYLKILSDISSNSDWVKCENFYQKIGLVPFSFLTILNQSEGKSLFENQNRISKRISDPIQELKKGKHYFKSNSLTNTTKGILSIEKNTEKVKNIFRSQQNHEASFPINTESSNTFRVASSIKPQLPPKPNVSIATKYTQCLNINANKTSDQNKPRPSKLKYSYSYDRGSRKSNCN